MSENAGARTERGDFQATTDPALLESADRGEAALLGYATSTATSRSARASCAT